MQILAKYNPTLIYRHPTFDTRRLWAIGWEAQPRLLGPCRPRYSEQDLPVIILKPDK